MLRQFLRRRASSSSTPAPPAAAHPASPTSLWVWGKVDEGRLGVPVSSLRLSARALALGPALGPTPLGAGSPLLARGGVTAVAVAAAKTLALAADGSLWSWGACAAGSLGHGPGDAGCRARAAGSAPTSRRSSRGRWPRRAS